MQSLSLIKQTVSEKKLFKDFSFENLPFLGPQQPIKISDQMQSISLIKQTVSEEKIFKHCFSRKFALFFFCRR